MRHAPFRPLFTPAQVRALRAEHERVRTGRQRAPKGWQIAKAAELGVSKWTISAITQGRNYADV